MRGVYGLRSNLMRNFVMDIKVVFARRVHFRFVSEPTQLKALSYPSKETNRGQYFVSKSMYIFDYKEDIIKDKPIDERDVPEILFEAAAEVDRVAPLASLGAVEGEVRRGDRRQERDPGQLDSRAAHAPGEALHLSK